ncbi:hypothetical protein NDU88_005360 [Pleurodeles waltl]|uniref:Uncharacterized protein n=1 Tax=Pleurodeles waltl TaxID=8319 RepID=A0AAV7LTW2_PLEWA|nr:hypothetical protein NDU88_005360 [Pleurodeles waltl]
MMKKNRLLRGRRSRRTTLKAQMSSAHYVVSDYQQHEFTRATEMVLPTCFSLNSAGREHYTASLACRVRTLFKRR